MKKILAAALALSLSAAMFTACGDDSSSSSAAETTTTTASSEAPAESSSEEASSEEASSADDASSAEGEGDASSSEGEGEGDAPVDISEAAKELKHLDDAQVTFTADTDVTTVIKDMQEGFSSIKQDAEYVKAGQKPNKKGEMEPYTAEDFDKIWSVKGKLYGLDTTYESEYVQKVLSGDTDDLIYVSGDESRCKYSIEEVAGVNMLKVEVLDKYPDGVNYLIPKPQIKLAEIFKGHEDLLPTVNTVKMDLIARAVGDFTGDDGSTAHCPGNFMGTLAIQALKEDGVSSKPWDQQDFATSEWVSEWVYCEAVSKELLIWNTQTLSNTTGDQYATLMRWGIPNDACFYIADIAFYDIDGNPIKW